jgi:hypothetical protein
LKRSKKPERRGGAKGRSRVLKRLGCSPSAEGSSGVAPTPSSSRGDPLIVDLTFSDEDTMELPSSSPMVEDVDTHACARVRFSEEIPDQILEAYLRHHSSGQGGVCPDVFSWCLNKLNVMYPDTPYAFSDFV